LRGRGEFAAVSEGERGRVVYVFDPNGRAFTETFEHPVHTFSVNRSGFLSVILQMPDGYAVYVFNRQSNGVPLYRRYIRESDNPGIVPVAAEVSEDGRYIAVGLLDVNNRLQSLVQYGFTSRGDTWGTDDVSFIFFQMAFPDEMLLSLRMTADGRLVAVTDARITGFTRRADANVIDTAFTVPLHNRLEHLAFDEEGRFAVAFGNALLNDSDAVPVGTVHIYGADGAQTGSYNAGRRVTHLSMGHGMVIVGADRNFHAVNARGEPVWEFISLQEVRDFFFLENGDTVLIAGGNRAEVWRRRGRDGETGDFFGIQGQE
jgi:hypothetical protein